MQSRHCHRSPEPRICCGRAARRRDVKPSVLILLCLCLASAAGLAETADPHDAQPPLVSAEVATVPIGYLKQEVKRFIPLSRLNVEPEDLGIAGAEIALKDNNTTGKFTKQQFALEVERVPVGGDAVPALEKMIESGHHFILVDVPAETLLRLSDAAKGKDVLLFNIRATDESLRQEDCRANVLHTAPDRAMLADALALTGDCTTASRLADELLNLDEDPGTSLLL